MRNLMKNKRIQYALMIIGAITVLCGIVIGANAYLTSKTYSIDFLGAGGQGLTYDSDEDLRTLVKKQVLSQIDQGGYLTEDDVKEVMTDELYEKIIDDVKGKVDTSIANEVANAVDGASLTESQIKAIVDREVQNYINSNSDELSEISKIKEQITALKKADSTLSTQLASNTKTATAGKDGKQGPKGEKGDPGMTTSEVKSVKDAATNATKTAEEAKKTATANAEEVKKATAAAEAAQAAAKTAADKKSGNFEDVSNDPDIVHMKWIE